MKTIIAHSILIVAVMLSATAWAASPLAPVQADHAAKQAVPPPDRALLYVYNVDAAKAPAVWLDGSEAGSLDTNTFMVLSVSPGRHELRQGPGGGGIAITVNAAQSYFVQLTGTGLRWVPAAQGRPAVQQSHLINDKMGFSKTLFEEPPPVTKPSPEKTPPAAKAPADAWRAGLALILKTGVFELSNDSQIFAGVQASYDSSASGLFAGELEWRTPSGLAFGGELIRYDNDISFPGLSARGEVSTTVGLVNVKKYFSTGSRWHPYIGAGIGSASIDFSGDTSGSGDDLAYQAMAGFDRRGDQVGLYGELKILSADISNNADVSGNGVFVGISIAF